MAKRTYDPEKLYSPREIAQTLNNAVVATLNPAASEIPQARLAKLQAYAKALTAPVIEHIDTQYLRYEEAVNILVSAAFYLHLKFIMGEEKVPYKPDIVFVDRSKLKKKD